MLCLIATEDSIAGIIKHNLQKSKSFSSWSFEICTDSNRLNDWSEKNVDVLILSRLLPGTDPVKLLQHVRVLFPSAHIVIWAGPLTESSKAYIRAASRAGLHNVVTGEKLPGDRPYNLLAALTRPKKPELDGYDGFDEGNEDNDEKDMQDAQDFVQDPAFEQNYGEDPILPGYSGSMKRASRAAVAAANTGILVVSTANKGGVGKTTAAIAVSTALSRAGIPTALVDLDLGAPDLATFFKIQGVPGIERLSGVNNPALVDRLLVDVESNLNVLPGPMTKTLPRFDAEELLSIINRLKSRFPVVICDTSPEPWSKRWLYSVFEAADMALAVVDQSKFSEEETRKYAPTLLMMGIKPEKIRIVVNRYSPKLHDTRLVEKMFNAGFKANIPPSMLPRIGAVIHENWDASVRGTYQGEIADLDKTSSQWHKLAREIATLAGYRYEPVSAAKGAARPRESLFRKLFRRGAR